MNVDRISVLAVLLATGLALACGGPSPEELVQSVSGVWSSQGPVGGLQIDLDREGGTLAGLGSDGTVQGRMAVRVTGVDRAARVVELQRVETEAPFRIELLDPASDGQARIRVSFPNGRELRLAYRGPLPSSPDGSEDGSGEPDDGEGDEDAEGDSTERSGASSEAASPGTEAAAPPAGTRTSAADGVALSVRGG